MPVREHPLALLRRQLLELLVSLHHTFALLRRQTAVACVLLLQFFAPRLRQLAPFAQPFEHSPALFGRQIAEGLEVLLHLFPQSAARTTQASARRVAQMARAAA